MSKVRFHRKQHTYFAAYISVTYSNLYEDGGLVDIETKLTFDKEQCRELKSFSLSVYSFFRFPVS